MTPMKSAHKSINFNFNFENPKVYTVGNVENFEINQSNFSYPESVVFDGHKFQDGQR